MGLQPNIAKRRNFLLKTCSCCGNSLSPESYAPTSSIFYPDGSLPMCNDCIEDYLQKSDFSWESVDKLCQLADIPFIPNEWERLHEMNGSKVFPIYANVFAQEEYEGLGWQEYYEAYKKLKTQGKLEEQLPELQEKVRRQRRERWGANYDDEAQDYLENLYNGLMTTQNVNGSLQVDQAVKLCKISYEIDCRIREGAEFDKLLSSYDKLVKIAEFTPKNVKNINDFDSVGELVKWMEKRHWKNKFFDGVTRDIVDESMKNFQNFSQRLYTNESGIGDNITERINALKDIQKVEQESYYGTNAEYDLDKFDDDGYVGLCKEEEFNADVGDDDNYG